MRRIYVGDGGSFVWQWQPKEQIVLEGYPEGVYVHYANCDTVEAPVVQTRMEGDKLVADIPPELMQSDKDITVYVCDVDGTMHCHFLSVLGRPKPESYVTEPVEVLRYESLAERVKKLEEEGVGGGGLTAEQEAALDGLLNVTAFTRPDVSAEIAAFRAAFGLDTSGGEDIPENPVDPEEPVEPEQPDDTFDTGFIVLNEQHVGNNGKATHTILDNNTLIVAPQQGGYAYILVNGLTSGTTYELYLQPYDNGGNASVYTNKTPDATDDSGYGTVIKGNGAITGTYDPLSFTLPTGAYGIIIYCYNSVTKMRLVEAEG